MTAEYPTILIRLYEDGRVAVDKDLFMSYEDGLTIPANIGHITLLYEKEEYTDIYVVSSKPGHVQAYLEGFLIGRNIDYVERKTLSSSKEYQKLIQNSFNKLRVEE